MRSAPYDRRASLLLEINPDDYLRDILTRLPGMTNQTARNYIPSKWKATRQTP
jgi:hypothetical protein